MKRALDATNATNAEQSPVYDGHVSPLILELLSEHLAPRTLVTCMAVCRDWRDVFQANWIWRRHVNALAAHPRAGALKEFLGVFPEDCPLFRVFTRILWDTGILLAAAKTECNNVFWHAAIECAVESRGIEVTSRCIVYAEKIGNLIIWTYEPSRLFYIDFQIISDRESRFFVLCRVINDGVFSLERVLFTDFIEPYLQLVSFY